MSDLQRSFAKSKLSNLPFNPPKPINVLEGDEDAFEEIATSATQEDEDSLKPLPSPNAIPEDDSSSASSASSASSVSSTGTIIPSPSQKLFARGKAPYSSTSRFAPLPWTDYFAQELRVTPGHPARITHHVYITPPSSKNAPLFVMHHGGGSSALSFAAVTSHIRRQLPSAGVLALDARGHGETQVEALEHASSESNGNVLDLSLASLSGDLERAYDAVRIRMDWPDDLPVVLVGHSLGGAVVATVAKEGRLKAKVLGFAVFDVVEGSAMDALQSMQGYLATRPRSFASVEEGIEWHLKSRTIRTAASARASVPALLKPEVVPPTFPTTGITPGSPTRQAAEKSEHTEEMKSEGGTARKQRWTWRTDLAATQPFWEDWFVGLSSKFLSARGGKLLLLAGTDRLDKELMIGQMQGKYQLQVFPEAGHFVHEDAPEKTATVLVDFWRRNDGSRLVLPPKVSEMIARGQRV